MLPDPAGMLPVLHGPLLEQEQEERVVRFWVWGDNGKEAGELETYNSYCEASMAATNHLEAG